MRARVSLSSLSLSSLLFFFLFALSPTREKPKLSWENKRAQARVVGFCRSNLSLKPPRKSTSSARWHLRDPSPVGPDTPERQKFTIESETEYTSGKMVRQSWFIRKILKTKSEKSRDKGDCSFMRMEHQRTARSEATEADGFWATRESAEKHPKRELQTDTS